ncbi:hypothetical protein JTE90_022191 [Oedothorax gibbosus]|uniref:Cns1/TTC4 wheel domain-containing protein n=1 Tax=Oedothorax gibbosus TaxID=931172 RepID=A0AAV6VQX5_9ARAC|nr:hypothetical protein JTE90_022191 [Oedothorax gibbosus]
MERSKLVEKLNKDVSDFLAQLQPKPYEDGWPEDKWEQEMEKHPAFMSKQVEDADDLPPLVEALRQLKYDPDENSPSELAIAFKEDGNVHFKHKKYRWAVDCYNKGLEVEGASAEIRAQLYANRATSQYHIGNYQKALRDSVEAKKLKPDYLKAYLRGVMCCLQLHEYSDAITWCNEGLKVEPDDTTLADMKRRAEEQKKTADRNRRKAIVQEAKKQKEFEHLKKIIQERGIHLADDKLDQCEVKPVHPALANARVHLDGDKLVWPVVFMYPEYGTTDYIQEFHEDSRFMDHLNVMFNSNNPPNWDKCRQYVAENLQVYFSDNEYIVPIEKTKTLKEALTHSRYKVHGGTPHFFITVSQSKFDRAFRKRNLVAK